MLGRATSNVKAPRCNEMQQDMLYSSEAQLAEIAKSLRRGFGVAKLDDFTPAEQQELLDAKLEQCSLQEVNEVWLQSSKYQRRLAEKQADHDRQLKKILGA